MKKKILYIHHGKGIGGAPLSLLYLIQALDKEQYQPIVLFLHDSDAIKLFKEHQIDVMGPVNRYDFPHTRIWWLRWYHALFFLKSIRDTIITRYAVANDWFDTIKPDIVHLNTSSLIAWGIVAHKRNIPVVWHIRELLADGYLGLRKKMITKIIEKNASVILPICKHDGNPWATSKKTTVIYNAAQEKLFDYTISPNSFITKHHLDPYAPKILFLGGLSKEKGTEFILSVFAELQILMPQALLLLAGYFPITQDTSGIKKIFPAYRFNQRVKSLYNPLTSSIKLLGPITNVHEALATCNVLVFPATIGHFARPIIEAGFMKKPVIASACAPLDELVLHGKTGFLIEPNNIIDWVTTLFLLLNDKKLQRSLGETGYIFCQDNFSIEEQIKKVEKIYRSFANEPN